MRILVLGATGKMGSVVIKDLVRSDSVTEVVATDLYIEKLRQLAETLSSEKLKVEQIDITDHSKLLHLMKENFNVVVSALNYVALREHYIDVVKAAIEAHVNYVDLVLFEPPRLYLPNIFELDKAAREAEVTLIPGCGLDPGINHICVGYASRQLEKVKKICLYCGGFPRKGTLGYRNPLHYKITFAWESVIRAVHGKAKILQDGRIVEVDKLMNPEIIEFPEPVGKCEAWYLEAPFSLIDQLGLKYVEEAWSKTVRWPGYCDMWKKLIDLHITSEEPLRIKGCDVTPREFLIALGNKILQYQEGEGDVVVERNIIIGERGSKEVTYCYDLIDFYDEKSKVTAMGRTTGYMCSIIAQMIGRGDIKEKGVVHPGKIGWNHEAARKFFTELARRNITITETIISVEKLKGE
jgi:saccharopine dehydrogenase-like NADP-dependent oxidoreductase